jgi:hypothetical protein
VAARSGIAAITARFGLASAFRVAAFVGFTTCRRVAAGFGRTTPLGGFVRLLGGSSESESCGDSGKDDDGEESMDQFHGSFDEFGLFEFGPTAVLHLFKRRPRENPSTFLDGLDKWSRLLVSPTPYLGHDS